VGNHLFVIFAVLDVSFAVNSCINQFFFTLIAYIVNIVFIISYLYYLYVSLRI